MYPPQTSGLNIPAKIVLDATKVTLSLVGTMTHQIGATLADLGGNVITPTAAFVYKSLNPGSVTVSNTGLISAVTPTTPWPNGGHAEIEISYPYAGRSNGDAIHATVQVTVTPEPAKSWSLPVAPTDDPTAGHGRSWKTVPESL